MKQWAAFCCGYTNLLAIYGSPNETGFIDVQYGERWALLVRSPVKILVIVAVPTLLAIFKLRSDFV
jgi:hypothetical protein